MGVKINYLQFQTSEDIMHVSFRINDNVIIYKIQFSNNTYKLISKINHVDLIKYSEQYFESLKLMKNGN